MQIDKTDLGNAVTRLKLAGRLDINGAAMVEIPLSLAAKNCQRLVIDMAGVSYVSSLGVRHLVMASKILGRDGGKLVLFQVTEPVAEILTTMGITDIIPLTASESAALALA
jgi:anti-anti-sigma factor